MDAALSVDGAAQPRILVADANDDTRSLYRQTFCLIRCDVVEASDGRDALTKALVNPPALVLTELRLPMLDGFALCDILRRDRTTAGVPIVVVTSESRPSELNAARHVADAVLVKPTTPDLVSQEIKRLLMRPELRRQQRVPVRAIAADTSLGRRSVLVKAHTRSTTTSPPNQPPTLTCSLCDRSLVYVKSYVGGVSERHSEQWDYFTCSACGAAFQYRQRTRKLRPLRNDEAEWIKALKSR